MIEIGYIPYEHHIVWVDGHQSLVLLINQSRQNVTERLVFTVRDFYARDASEDVGGTEGWWFAEREFVF